MPTSPDAPAAPGRRRLFYAAAGTVGAGAALYGAVVGALWLRQERLLFHPEPLDAAVPLAGDADVHERWVDVPGARLSVLELRLPDPKGVVYYLHGNAGNLRSWFVNPDFYRRAGYDLVMPDYRGYGKSSGRIESEAQLHADVEAVWRSVAPRYGGRRVVFCGRSLGSGLAVALAVREQPHLTLLVSPYASLPRLAQLHYPWVPSSVLRYRLDSAGAIAGIAGPVQLVHGAADALIPVEHSRALQALARQARLTVVPGAGHGDLQDHAPYWQAIADALASAAAPSTSLPVQPLSLQR